MVQPPQVNGALHVVNTSPHSSDPEAQLSSRNELDRLRRHLSRMFDKLAETLLSHDVLGCDLAETATLVAALLAATQSRLVRSRKDLTARIREDREALQQCGATR